MLVSEEIKQEAEKLALRKTHWLNKEKRTIRYTREYQEQLQILLRLNQTKD